MVLLAQTPDPDPDPDPDQVLLAQKIDTRRFYATGCLCHPHLAEPSPSPDPSPSLALTPALPQP